jgi:NAD(P)-dependent dehydrogenase (short-subunit alcohol dehydrogenase family)
MMYIVTGGTRGIGAAVAAQLVGEGREVAVVGRDLAAARSVAESLNRSGSGRAVAVEGELGSVAGAKAAAGRLGELGPIAALIHNAGLWPRARALNRDELEASFVVNHLAPWILNRLLHTRLLASGARVVQVSAGLFVAGRVDLRRTPTGEDFSALRTYADTKRANVLASRWLAARWGVSLSLVHPGVVRTGLGESGGGLLDLLMRPVKALWLSPSEGARGPCRLATDPALAGRGGLWYDRLDERPWPAAAEDDALGEALAQQADALAGLEPLR